MAGPPRKKRLARDSACPILNPSAATREMTKNGNIDRYNLRTLAAQLAEAFPEVVSLRLFGSRRYRTKSRRSDIDVLVETSGFIAPAEFRRFSSHYCAALDVFVVTGRRAVSCANESFVEAATFGELVARLEAVEFWNRKQGVLNDADVEWQIEVQQGIEFPPTMMDGVPFAAWGPALTKAFAALERDGIPVQPYIGPTLHDWARFLRDLIRRMVETAAKGEFRGKGVKISLENEYDFQDLFHVVAKPWLPGLEREPVVVYYDGQEKRADFAIAKSRIVIELKCIKDANTKGTVVKTLSGLQDFYQRNANVRLLVFAVLALPGVQVDADRWEADYSHEHQDVIVRTVVVKVGA
jgi:hypothetical protein